MITKYAQDPAGEGAEEQSLGESISSYLSGNPTAALGLAGLLAGGLYGGLKRPRRYGRGRLGNAILGGLLGGAGGAGLGYGISRLPEGEEETENTEVAGIEDDDEPAGGKDRGGRRGYPSVRDVVGEAGDEFGRTVVQGGTDEVRRMLGLGKDKSKDKPKEKPEEETKNEKIRRIWLNKGGSLEKSGKNEEPDENESGLIGRAWDTVAKHPYISGGTAGGLGGVSWLLGGGEIPIASKMAKGMYRAGRGMYHAAPYVARAAAYSPAASVGALTALGMKGSKYLGQKGYDIPVEVPLFGWTNVAGGTERAQRDLDRSRDVGRDIRKNLYIQIGEKLLDEKMQRGEMNRLGSKILAPAPTRRAVDAYSRMRPGYHRREDRGPAYWNTSLPYRLREPSPEAGTPRRSAVRQALLRSQSPENAGRMLGWHPGIVRNMQQNMGIRR